MYHVNHRLPQSLVLLALLTLGPEAMARDAAAGLVYQRSIRSTVWVTGSQMNGTGWLADRPRRLIVTNYHLVQNDRVVHVVFPHWRAGKVIREPSYYQQDRHIFVGRVVARWPRADLAVIQLPKVAAGARPLRLAARPARPGGRVFWIGNSGPLWIFRSAVVRRRSLVNTRWNGQSFRVHARMLIQSPASRPGDSGGPVLNRNGQLVGVTVASNGRLGYAIDVREVRALLAHLGHGPRKRAAAALSKTNSYPGCPVRRGNLIGRPTESSGSHRATRMADRAPPLVTCCPTAKESCDEPIPVLRYDGMPGAGFRRGRPGQISPRLLQILCPRLWTAESPAIGESDLVPPAYAKASSAIPQRVAVPPALVAHGAVGPPLYNKKCSLPDQRLQGSVLGGQLGANRHCIPRKEPFPLAEQPLESTAWVPAIPGSARTPLLLVSPRQLLLPG
jgi:putative serine protease PepD